MKKILGLLVLIVLITIFLNRNVTARKCINYQCQTIRIPLYLKLLDFFDRHYNYSHLTSQIIKGASNDTERVMKIFRWAHENIRQAPDSLPIIDDHSWHVIIRGYGADDQVADVFATFCNYAGVRAFYSAIFSEDGTSNIPLSFVRIGKKWVVFDPARGIYFKNKQGELADAKEIKTGNWGIEKVQAGPGFDYAIYLNNLPEIGRVGLQRTNIQSPLKRICFMFTKWIKK